MKKQIIGFFAIIALIAVVMLPSTAHSINTGNLNYSFVSDTIPDSMNRMHNDTSWNNNKMRDTANQYHRKDSTAN